MREMNPQTHLVVDDRVLGIILGLICRRVHGLVRPREQRGFSGETYACLPPLLRLRPRRVVVPARHSTVPTPYQHERLPESQVVVVVVEEEGWAGKMQKALPRS